jgi:hypothetical protein
LHLKSRDPTLRGGLTLKRDNKNNKPNTSLESIGNPHTQESEQATTQVPLFNLTQEEYAEYLEREEDLHQCTYDVRTVNTLYCRMLVSECILCFFAVLGVCLSVIDHEFAQNVPDFAIWNDYLLNYNLVCTLAMLVALH